jgi:hypothetical protein
MEAASLRILEEPPQGRATIAYDLQAFLMDYRRYGAPRGSGKLSIHDAIFEGIVDVLLKKHLPARDGDIAGEFLLGR